MITIENALKIILEETQTLGLEYKDILSSLNYILGENIHSKDTIPPFDKSAMDGYAVRSDDSNSYTTLKIKGIIKAGDYYSEELKAGEALKIMTGAALPPGADAVIEVEKVKVDGENLFLSSFPPKWNNVIRRGEEISIGDLAIAAGKIIRPPEIGFLASLGYANVAVYKKPTIAMLITGDELVDIHEELTEGKIRNCNEYSLNALIQNIGAKPLSLGMIPDDKTIIREKMIHAFNNADIVISSGGASVGDYDFIETVLKEIGADIKFTKVSIKPGKPITFATYNNKLFFGVPGNPLSLITIFEEFIRPCILKMSGSNHFFNKEMSIVIGNSFKVKKRRTKYVYVDIRKEEGQPVAYNFGPQSSNYLRTIVNSNGVVIVPEGIEELSKGMVLKGRYI